MASLILAFQRSGINTVFEVEFDLHKIRQIYDYTVSDTYSWCVLSYDEKDASTVNPKDVYVITREHGSIKIRSGLSDMAISYNASVARMIVTECEKVLGITSEHTSY